MLSFLPHNLKGILSIFLYTINTILLTIPMIFLSCFKFILPVKSIVIILDKILISIATLWIGINSFNSKLFCKIEWDLRGIEKLEKKWEKARYLSGNPAPSYWFWFSMRLGIYFFPYESRTVRWASFIDYFSAFWVLSFDRVVELAQDGVRGYDTAPNLWPGPVV